MGYQTKKSVLVPDMPQEVIKERMESDEMIAAAMKE